MTEENETKECKCMCKSKEFKSFLIVMLGSFLGVYFALCLFFAVHKPPMMMPMPMYGHGHMMQMHHQFNGPHHFKKHMGEMPQINFKEHKGMHHPMQMPHSAK